MRKAIRLAAGAAAMLMAAAPAAAQSSGLAAASQIRHLPGTVSGQVAPRFPGSLSGRFVRHDGRCRRFGRLCFGRNLDAGLLLGYYADAYGGLTEDPEALRDQGFFAEGNNWAENGRAVYEYDRGYPYDWYREPAAAAPMAEQPAYAGPAVRCDVSWVAAARGERSPVRVCRGGR